MDFVGRVDLRALNAEIAILLAAFVASVARLLWGRVQPWIVWMALLVIVISAELLHPIPLMAERLVNVLAERRVARPSAMAETGSS